ncbi:MAG: hypothetical protein OXK80_03855 [Bdellovibrionales bacterium]|nr:hypothetical protein [Bdellovibrionales bacterium]
MQSFYNTFIEKLKKQYPSAPVVKEHLLNCVSPFTIEIPASAFSKMETAVKTIYQWSRENLPLDKPEIAKVKIKNESVLMAYDFHLDEENNPRLIEINTNASGFLVTDLIQKSHGIQTKALELLRESFFKEWHLFSNSSTPPSYTAIVDENIDMQKMKFEFFMYHDLMNNWGWNTKVLDVKNLKINQKDKLIDPGHIEIDFIYNRLTDFYLKKFSLLKQAYEQQTSCFSPNPKEYSILAYKKNLCLLYEDSKISADNLLQQILIPSELLDARKDAWENKKTLFFKPIESYGGGGSYRGKSITKKKFSELENYIVQEYIPPQTWKDPINQDQWKFDIRAYVYQDQIQLLGGRIYKGQVTNFQNPLGGFCLVHTK